MKRKKGVANSETREKYAVCLEKGWLKESCSPTSSDRSMSYSAMQDLVFSSHSCPGSIELGAVCVWASSSSHTGGNVSNGQEGKAGGSVISLILNKLDIPAPSLACSLPALLAYLHWERTALCTCTAIVSVQGDSAAFEQP